MIKTVIFDIDNTLYDYKQAHAAAFEALTDYAGNKLGLGPEMFADLHRKAEKELKAYIGDAAAVHNRTIRYQHLLEHQGMPLYPHVLEMTDRYWNTLMEASRPSPGAAQTMEALKKQGIRIGIGTDMTAYTQFQKLTKLGLLAYVDFLVSSEETGAEKPEPVFFERCQKKAGCSADECLFVGDSLKKDVQGAARAGMKALWYHPSECRPLEEVLLLEKLQDLPRIVSEL